MASWMVHLRIADRLLERLPDLEVNEFVLGNIAPDSGVPSEDWSYYVPSSEESHFKRPNESGDKRVCLPLFVEQYFSPEIRAGYDAKQYSFFLGYLVHLMTDILWVQNIYEPCERRYPKEVREDRNKLLWSMKRDWYDLDFVYLQEHPDFRAFEIYRSARDIENVYMDIFGRNAFENRREYIVGFYTAGKDDLDHEYNYLNKAQMDAFVEESVVTLLEQLQEFVK